MSYVRQLLLLGVLGAQVLCADVIVATWNMKWFPSGLADRPLSAEQEHARIRAAGEVIGKAYRTLSGTNEVGFVFFAQEMRDRTCCSNLAHATGIAQLKLIELSNYKDTEGVSLWQQQAVFSTLPVLDRGYTVWSAGSGLFIPRGFTYALLDQGASRALAVFCVHLKSNVNRSGGAWEDQRNIFQREEATEQILRLIRNEKTRLGSQRMRILIGGDFNTDEDNPAFISEATLRSLYGAHFRSCFRDWKKEQRITHPGNGIYPDATFDYIFYRGFDRLISRRIFDGSVVSDHHLVGIRLREEPAL